MVDVSEVLRGSIGVDEPLLDQLIGASTRRLFRAGETIFREGDAATSVHVLRAGLVAVRVGPGHGDDILLAILGPGELFGEQAALRAHATRVASVEAIRDTRTLEIPRASFEELRRCDPAVDRYLLETLSARMNRLAELLVDALRRSHETRIVSALTQMAELEGEGPRNGPLELQLTQRALGELAGVPLRTTQDKIRRLVADDLVRPAGRGRLVVVDLPGLRARLGSIRG
ncbi:MAG: Crp/Fnr family transcriptional regulator [Actinomycetota bacterium]|nr:Crp/Fnr family transcriptional regulator [Actinomycetota bacterium]